MNKKISSTTFILLACILLANLASAEFWACFNDGQPIKYCNPKANRICDSSGGCILCMDSYNEIKGCYNQGNWMVCNTLSQQCAGGGGTEVVPLSFTLTSPVNKSIYSSRKVPFSLESNKRATYYYIDAINGRGRWSRICSSCTSFNGGVSFKDGYNNLIVKAVAANGEEIVTQVEFRVDSKKPRIKRTYPRPNKFADGNFTVEYDEDNIKEVKLGYGNSVVGYRTTILSGCPEGKKQQCSAQVDLKDYDGQEIEYYFSMKDIADNFAESKHVTAKVDITFPKMQLAWKQEEEYIYFNITVEEANFDSIDYIDWNDARPQWRTLCSRLRDGNCEKRKSFRTGHHDLSVQVTDEAGNAISQNMFFDI